MFRRPRPAPAVLAVLATLLLAAPVAAQTGPAAQREAAEDALADAQRLADGKGIRTGRELTTALLEVARERKNLSRSDREAADRLLARPTDPGGTGVDGPYAPSARVLRACSAHFCVHWVDSTDDAPPLADANGCALPDYVEKVIAGLEQSSAVENDELGWRPPVPDGTRGGNSLTDVYLKQLNAGGGGLYGFAATEIAGSSRTQPAYMVLDNDYSAAEFPSYHGDPTIPIQVTAAHEYNHVLQYAYDVSQDAWMYESTATWAEEKVFPADDDYHLYMGTWADKPTQPLTSADGLKMYGSAIWNHWLEQRYGAEAVRGAWQQSAATPGFAPAAYDLAIKTAGGTSFATDFGDFAAATAEWDGADSGIHEGAAFPRDVRRAGNLAVGGSNTATALDHTGFELFNVYPKPGPGSDPIRLTATLRQGIGDGATGTVALIGIDHGDVTKVVARTDPSGGSASVVLGDPGRFSRITAVVANADTRNLGYVPAIDDWKWDRDAEPVSVSLATANGAAPSTPVEETDHSTPTTAVTDPACAAAAVERDPSVEPAPTPAPTASATAAPTVTPTVTPTPTPQPPVATSIRLTRNSTKLSSVLRKGVLSLFAQTNKAGRHAAKATLDTRTAKRLGIGRRTTTAGSGRRTAVAPARLKITVKLTRKVRNALKRHRRRAVRIKVAVTFTPLDGTGAVRRTLTITLRP
jgi:hypothetical protein